jgi:(1->4)-alpha-D-glucan 1-alpha-D-glucosylmutase
MLEYLGKALREEKTNTSWVETDADYERRVAAFCRALYASRAFSDELDRLAARVALRAQRAALGQVLLKVASPGVPDVYQGDELVDLSLVDPDNRRSVDWALRRELLAEVRAGAPPDGELAKPALLHRGLALRARRPADLGPGAAYRPLAATPEVVAFARGAGVLAAVALRARAEDAEVEVPPDLRGHWRHVVTEARVTLGVREPVSALCAGFPVALLERDGHAAGRSAGLSGAEACSAV